MVKFIAQYFSDDLVFLLLFFVVSMLVLTVGGIWADRSDKRKQRNSSRSMATPRR
ncbi:hypothetical protein QU487_07010 [Crenobacter sp. SG2305]|uniref:hypothetical protein n=1 Tax=Crenobacter oryzisoli TaxID=3056844 RepID=UPI0025AAE335|nr:hypothetical protein [Crenobacter sp. SG2305]MDN0082505.1 hypothetical protein [Crenobacter sp. SG2305]